MQIVIDIPEKTVNEIKDNAMFSGSIPSDIRWDVTSAIVNGTPLPKGHGRLIDEKDLSLMTVHMIDGMFVCDAPTIIEADKEYEVEVVTRGNCMMCGKELTEGLFFCKECGNKADGGK